jgi:23S rRNA-/tRNA-specific pseudouridylate synthase
VRHFVHRHEPPVPLHVINILSVTPDFVVVDKPPCTPVHVAGQYRKNTVVGILEASRKDLGELHPVHRLDKPVSGVLILSRGAAAAEAVRQRIVNHTVQKVYVARVQGAAHRSTHWFGKNLCLSWAETEMCSHQCTLTVLVIAALSSL